MPKFWPVDQRLLADGLIYLVNEDVWFQQNQKLLLAIANTDFGRELLCIPKEYPKILHMRKNCLHFYQDGQFHADFRIGAKWANVIRHRWEAFQSYSRYFRDGEMISASPLTRFALSVVNLTLTAYPDPNTETTTVDGFSGKGNSSSYSTTHDATDGTDTNDSAAYFTAWNTFTTTPVYYVYRSFTLFDTSSLTGSASISSATYSLWGDSGGNKADNLSDSVGVVTCSPASNTALVHADYDQFTTTLQATSITIASFSLAAYNDYALNGTGIGNISLTGVTKFGVRLVGDINNTTPTDNGTPGTYVHIESADLAGTSNDPKLVVTYTISAGNTQYLPILGVG